MIRNLNYVNNDIFNLEMKLLHNSSWVFICLKNQILENNDFVTYEIGEKKLVLQNLQGVIKCFENICQHRFNNIQSGEKGNSGFFCKYHGWVYDSEGKALVKDKFKDQLISEKRDCLKEYQVEYCGDFVFVKINLASHDNLKAHLGVFYDILTDLSCNFDSLLNNEYISIPHNANWKLLVENVLECYHCSTVHKDTLVPIGIGSKKPENNVVDKNHDMIDYPIRIGKQQKLRNEKLSFLDKRDFKHNSLRHLYIYPNLFITSTDGILFYVGKLAPQSPTTTNLLATFVRPKLNELTKKETMLSNAFFNASLESAQKVVYEDKAILENIQDNLSLVKDLSQIFGEEEFRIENFHKNIKKNINYI